MINITHNKTKYKIANEVNEITLAMYQKIVKIKDVTPREYIGTVINILSGMPIDVVNKISYKDITIISDSINVMLTTAFEELQPIIYVQGEKYVFEENLDTLRFDQFIDLSEMTDNEDKINDNLHLIAAILYHKVVDIKKPKWKLKNLIKRRKYENIYEDYNTATVLKNSSIFKEHMTMDVMFGLILFFSHLRLISLRNSLDSLRKKESQTTQE